MLSYLRSSELRLAVKLASGISLSLYLLGINYAHSSCIDQSYSSTCTYRIASDGAEWVIRLSSASVSLARPYISKTAGMDVAVRNIANILDSSETSAVSLIYSADGDPDCSIYGVSQTGDPLKDQIIASLQPGLCREQQLYILRFAREAMRFTSIDGTYSVESIKRGYTEQYEAMSNTEVGETALVYSSFKGSQDRLTSASTEVLFEGWPGKTYQVNQGDNLWSMSEDVVGRGDAWPLLFSMNPQLESPDMVSQGSTLFLPVRIVGWDTFEFTLGDSRNISEQIYGTKDYFNLVESLCNPRPSGAAKSSCIMPLFDD